MTRFFLNLNNVKEGTYAPLTIDHVLEFAYQTHPAPAYLFYIPSPPQQIITPSEPKIHLFAAIPSTYPTLQARELLLKRKRELSRNSVIYWSMGSFRKGSLEDFAKIGIQIEKWSLANFV